MKQSDSDKLKSKISVLPSKFGLGDASPKDSKLAPPEWPRAYRTNPLLMPVEFNKLRHKLKLNGKQVFGQISAF